MKTAFWILSLMAIAPAARAGELNCALKGGGPGDHLKIATDAGKFQSADLVTFDTQENPPLERVKPLFAEARHLYGGYLSGNCYLKDNSFADATLAGEVYAACAGADVAGDVTFDLKLAPDHSGSAQIELSNAVGTQYEWNAELVSCTR